MAYKAEVVVKHGAKTTGEGPVWIYKEQSLLYLDVLEGEIHKWDSNTGIDTSIQFDDPATFVVPHRDCGYVAGIGRKILHFDWSSHKDAVVLAEVEERSKTRLSDGKCDPMGRLWTGTMSDQIVPEMARGRLYSLDSEATLKEQEEKSNVCNGLVWAPDWRVMYHIDSVPGLLYAYDYDIATGAADRRRVALDLSSGEHGIPDRMTIDTNGNLWVAFFLGGKVSQINPETGQFIRDIRLRCATTTACAFGGAHFNELYVTTSASGVNFHENPLAGSVFRISGLGARGYSTDAYFG